MTQEAFWKQAESMFHEVVARPPGERGTYLDEQCAGQPALRCRIEKLLACDQEQSNLLDRGAGALLDPLRENVFVGEVLGAYRIVRLLGRGGMGVVYLATRCDGRYDKQVAIKIVKRGLETEEILARFQRERQTLANLEHPNIAKLHDGGSTPDGRPYLVMENVQGRSIDRYCSEDNLTIDQRLKLFQQVCVAVQYAHQNLVVHRDLKPSNILVTQEGTPKLLDFGIAKILRSQDVAAATLHTQFPKRVFSPEYASPEQIRGESITTASDVYSLGVLLYQLLTEQSPYDLRKLSPAEVERTICDTPPSRPSVAVKRTGSATGSEASDGLANHSCTERHRRLKGDLDNIVLLALRKEPLQRYASVGHLSEDIRRHLENRPVLARPQSSAYVLHKYVRRHLVSTLLSAALVLSLATLAISSHLKNRGLQRERDIAVLAQQGEREARQVSEEINALLHNMLASADPSSGSKDMTVRDLLDRASNRIEQEALEPEIEAALRTTIGDTYMTLGLNRQAEQHFRSALKLRRSLYKGEHALLLQSLNYSAHFLDVQGNNDEAKQMADEALAMGRVLFPNGHALLASCLMNQGVLSCREGDYATAVPLLHEALDMQRLFLGERHEGVAKSLASLGTAHYWLGDIVSAEACLRQALQVRRELYGNDHASVATGLVNLASVLRKQGQFAEAVALSREALATQRRVLGNEHPDLAHALNNLANQLQEVGELEEAENSFTEALKILRSVHGPGHPHDAHVLRNLGYLQLSQEDYGSAAATIREALSIWKAKLPAGHWRLADTESLLGDCLIGLEQYEEAEPYLRNSYSILKSTRGEKDSKTQEGLERIVRLYERWDKPAQAEQYRTMLARADTPAN